MCIGVLSLRVPGSPISRVDRELKPLFSLAHPMAESVVNSVFVLVLFDRRSTGLTMMCKFNGHRARTKTVCTYHASDKSNVGGGS